MLTKMHEMARNAAKMYRNWKQCAKSCNGWTKLALEVVLAAIYWTRNVQNNVKVSVNGVGRPQSLDFGKMQVRLTCGLGFRTGSRLTRPEVVIHKRVAGNPER